MTPRAPEPITHEHLPGVPRLCDRCWHPIPWGQLSWRLVARIPEPSWIWMHTACLLAGTTRSAA